MYVGTGHRASLLSFCEETVTFFLTEDNALHAVHDVYSCAW